MTKHKGVLAIFFQCGQTVKTSLSLHQCTRKNEEYQNEALVSNFIRLQFYVALLLMIQNSIWFPFSLSLILTQTAVWKNRKLKPRAGHCKWASPGQFSRSKKFFNLLRVEKSSAEWYCSRHGRVYAANSGWVGLRWDWLERSAFWRFSMIWARIRAKDETWRSLGVFQVTFECWIPNYPCSVKQWEALGYVVASSNWIWGEDLRNFGDVYKTERNNCLALQRPLTGFAT